jgi:hypothetical protein
VVHKSKRSIIKKLKIRKIKKSLKSLDYSFTPPPSWKRLSD